MPSNITGIQFTAIIANNDRAEKEALTFEYVEMLFRVNLTFSPSQKASLGLASFSLFHDQQKF